MVPQVIPENVDRGAQPAKPEPQERKERKANRDRKVMTETTVKEDLPVEMALPVTWRDLLVPWDHQVLLFTVKMDIPALMDFLERTERTANLARKVKTKISNFKF
jgi:hypothetical protein